MRISRAFRNYSIPNVGTFVKSRYEHLCINVKNIDDFIENYNYLMKNTLKIMKAILKGLIICLVNFNFFIENIKN